MTAEIQNAREQLASYEALGRVFEDPHLVIDLLLGADSPESATDLLRERFGLSKVQTSAVLDLQFRRATRRDRRRIVGETLRLREHLDSLSGPAG
jgi:DNA gyrase/topoisomerase IV subunit A